MAISRRTHLKADELAPTAAVVSALAETGTFTTFTALQQNYPNVGLTSYSSGGGSVNAYSGSEGPTWEFADSFTSIHGKHTLGFGVDYRRWHLIRNLDDDFYGDFSFGATTIQKNNEAIGGNGDDANTSSCPNAPVSVMGAKPVPLCGTANAIGDMLTGYYSGVGGFVPGPLSPTTTAGNPQNHVFTYFAPYAEDDFKVTQKLSLNYGLRWDFRAAPYEASNHFFWRDLTNPDGGTLLCRSTAFHGWRCTWNWHRQRPNSAILWQGSSLPVPSRLSRLVFGFNYRFNDKMGDPGWLRNLL